MKTKLPHFAKVSALIMALIILPALSQAQTLIYYWNFNNNVPGENQNWQQPIPATTGAAEITYTFSEAFSFAGTTVNGTEGEVNGGSLAPRGGVNNINNGEYFAMTAPTSGYQNIVLSYPTRRTSTGFNTQEIKYTIDGSTWLTKETVDISAFQNNWLPAQLITVNFSGVAGVDNNPDFAIRVVLTGVTSSAGNNRFDNIRISGMQMGAVQPPSDFTAQAAGTSQINLNWNPNGDNDPVLLAWSENGTFGVPTGVYIPGEPIPGGGNVLSMGSSTTYSHTGLDAGTTYYYKAWSYDGSDYSQGVSANTTTDPDPVFATLPYNENFDSNLGQCYTYSVSGPTRVWAHATTDGNGYAMMNGFGSTTLEEDWLILPGIDLSSYAAVILNFETAWNFGVENENNYLKLFYSTDYAGVGDPTSAGWTALEFTKPATGGYVWQSSGNIELPGVQGVVWLGFKYHFSEEYRRWQVDNIHIFEADAPLLTVEPTTLSGFTYQTGSGPSAGQSFNVGGINLTHDITITPPANYEISLGTGANFVATDPVVLTHDNGTVEPTAIYVRLKAGLEIGTYNEMIQISSADANPVQVICNGSVTPVVIPPLVIDDPDFVYMQDFNTLALSGTGNAWTDNETLLGWYWQCQNPDRDPNSVGYWAQDGSNNNVQATSFGATDSGDRALGSISGGSNRNFYHGVQLRNNTGAALNLSEIFISFTGEQWRQTINQHTLVFGFRKSSTIISNLLEGTWTPNTSLDFAALHTGTDGALNGNDPANRTEFFNLPLAGEGTLAPGEYLMLRWAKTGSTAPGLAIDDFIFSLSEVTIIENPGNFTAVSSNTSEIDLSWQLNSNSNPVLLAWSANGVFGSTPDTQTPGEEISGGGIVMYFGPATAATHEELEAGTTYYYKIWSFSNGEYSSGVTAQATTMPLPATTALPYNENFDEDLGDCYVYSVSGNTKYWIHNSFEGNGYAYINGHNSGDLEIDWLILPGINFNNYENKEMAFSTWKRFGEDDDENYLKLYYSTNYPGTGDPSSFTWSELAFEQPDEEQTWASSGIINLNGLNGELVYIGFKYYYNTGNYRIWQVDNISVTGDAVGIGKKPNRQQLAISPNPTTGLINIEIPPTASLMRIYDLPGNLVEEIRVNEQMRLLDLGSYKKGLYFIEVTFTDGKPPARSKVILQ